MKKSRKTEGKIARGIEGVWAWSIREARGRKKKKYDRSSEEQDRRNCLSMTKMRDLRQDWSEIKR